MITLPVTHLYSLSAAAELLGKQGLICLCCLSETVCSVEVAELIEKPFELCTSVVKRNYTVD